MTDGACQGVVWRQAAGMPHGIGGPPASRAPPPDSWASAEQPARGECMHVTGPGANVQPATFAEGNWGGTVKSVSIPGSKKLTNNKGRSLGLDQSNAYTDFRSLLAFLCLKNLNYFLYSTFEVTRTERSACLVSCIAHRSEVSVGDLKLGRYCIFAI